MTVRRRRENLEGGSLRLTSGDEAPRSYARGRVCAEDGCGVVLNRYNPESRCVVHFDSLDESHHAQPLSFVVVTDEGDDLEGVERMTAAEVAEGWGIKRRTAAERLRAMGARVVGSLPGPGCTYVYAIRRVVADQEEEQDAA